jgi:hypothetical protein
MSNPTTPFGWQMPTAVDLVTDLPADFEVFGQAVATSLADLLGGASGYILSKASATDMDFTWIANDQGDITGVTAGTGISGGGTSGTVTVTNSMATAIDAKGDLIGGTGADTFARLAVGSNGHVLTADSAQATGLKWAAAPSGKVLQVVNATTATTVTVASTSFTDGGLTATITPTSNTSKILVFFTQPAYILRNTDQASAGYQILRNATAILVSDAEAFYVYVGSGANSAQLRGHNTVQYMDSPATTSALTYKVQWKVASTANSGSVTLQPGIPDTGSITLMEIGA